MAEKHLEWSPYNYVLNRGPQVPLTYTIREQLARIGNPSTTTYPFSAQYAYHPNGTVQTAEFYNAGAPVTEKRYRYVSGTSTYDALNRLKSADYSHYNGGWLTTSAYDLAGIAYDAAGNCPVLLFMIYLRLRKYMANSVTRCGE